MFRDKAKVESEANTYETVCTHTLSKIGIPDVNCQTNKPIPPILAPIWTVRAVSFPFCICGTMSTAQKISGKKEKKYRINH